ncbi:MAG TPA: aldo/keto reductase [Candidatus Dormibacteraeota bacterium]|nr:aldo/keto reductase [Candidatus Dormibacteraeota bacterium]
MATHPVQPATTLPTRPLGLGGPEVTTAGFGAWALGGGDWSFSWGPQDDEQSIAAILHAVDLGVTWIDTASVYGHGHSEEVVGRALERIPPAQRPLVFTKCGLVWDAAHPHVPARRDLRPDTIRRHCDESLRRLGVDVLDLLQFHWPDETGTPVEESWGTMLELVAAGKVRAGGVSNFDVGLLERCEALGHVTSLQPPFSLVNRRAAADVLPWCSAHGTGVIVYSPMQSGLLTGAFSAERVDALAPDDWRRRAEDFREPALSRNLALVDALRPVADRRGVSVAALAVAWAIAFAEVSGAIVGARSPAQVDGWIGAVSVDLDAEEMREIAGAIERTGAGEGPDLPVG